MTTPTENTGGGRIKEPAITIRQIRLGDPFQGAFSAVSKHIKTYVSNESVILSICQDPPYHPFILQGCWCFFIRTCKIQRNVAQISSNFTDRNLFERQCRHVIMHVSIKIEYPVFGYE